jgi:hypothetical protein
MQPRIVHGRLETMPSCMFRREQTLAAYVNYN